MYKKNKKKVKTSKGGYRFHFCISKPLDTQIGWSPKNKDLQINMKHHSWPDSKFGLRTEVINF